MKWFRVVFHFALEHKPVKLQLYWHLRQKDCEFLKEVQLKEAFSIYLEDDFTEEIAKLDGFESKEQGLSWFKKTYPKDWNIQQFYVIRW